MIATLESVASCADSSSELRPPFQHAVACRVFPKETQSLFPEAFIGREAVALENGNRQVIERGNGNLALCTQGCGSLRPAHKPQAADLVYRWKM